MSKKNAYITGTLQPDRKQTLSQEIGEKLQEGEMVFTSHGDISVTRWKDKRDVRVISNAHVPTMMDSVIRHGKFKGNPKVVYIYTNHMLGISRSDQMLLFNSALRKIVKGYKKVGKSAQQRLLYVQQSPWQTT